MYDLNKYYNEDDFSEATITTILATNACFPWKGEFLLCYYNKHLWILGIGSMPYEFGMLIPIHIGNFGNVTLDLPSIRGGLILGPHVACVLKRILFKKIKS